MLSIHKLKENYTVENAIDFAAMWDSLKPPACDVRDPAPSTAQLEAWMGDGGCEAVGCGCWVEPDGTCECGNPSWLLKLGWI